VKKIIFTLGALTLLGFGALLFGQQGDNLNMHVANLSEDMSLLTQQVRQLRLDQESLQQENAALRVQVESLKAQQVALSKAVDGFSKNMQSQSADLFKQKQEIIDTVTKQLDKISRPAPAAPQKKNASANNGNGSPTMTSFSQDYPKNGVVYTVEKGDTLSGVAQKLKSSCKDIQNANHIGNPKDLRVGQVLFIPQKENKNE